MNTLPRSQPMSATSADYWREMYYDLLKRVDAGAFSGVAYTAPRFACDNCGDDLPNFCGTCREMGCSASSTERWTEQEIAEAKAEAKELHDYFHPSVTSPDGASQ